MLCQFYGCLSAELHYRSVRFLDIYDTLDVLVRKRFKIKLIRYIEVRTYRFRIVIDYYCLISLG